MLFEGLCVESEPRVFLTCAEHHSNALEHYAYHFGFNKHMQYEYPIVEEAECAS